MPEMHEQLLDQVRAAFEPGAPVATRQLAAQACRMMLAVLDPTAAASSAPASSPPPAAPSSPFDALLDGLVARFAPHLPTNDPSRPPPTMSIPIVAIPTNLYPKG
jgi:hypothetical protein